MTIKVSFLHMSLVGQAASQMQLSPKSQSQYIYVDKGKVLILCHRLSLISNVQLPPDPILHFTIQ